MKLSKRQQQVVDYLGEAYRIDSWTSPTAIGQMVWGEGHHSSSASPVCLRLVQKGVLERNENGHYRLKETKV